MNRFAVGKRSSIGSVNSILSYRANVMKFGSRWDRSTCRMKPRRKKRKRIAKEFRRQKETYLRRSWNLVVVMVSRYKHSANQDYVARRYWVLSKHQVCFLHLFALSRTIDWNLISS